MGEAAGIRVRAYDLTGGDLGAVHLPLPVLVGDIVAFDEACPTRSWPCCTPTTAGRSESESAR
jgi:hypothetical protein